MCQPCDHWLGAKKNELKPWKEKSWCIGKPSAQYGAKLEWHYTLKHGSWLNMAECELASLMQQCLSRRLPDRQTITKEVNAWEERRNEAKVRINWQFSTADGRIKLRRLYAVIKEQNSG